MNPHADDLDLWLDRQCFLDTVRACRGATEHEIAARFLRYSISREVDDNAHDVIGATVLQ